MSETVDQMQDVLTYADQTRPPATRVVAILLCAVLALIGVMAYAAQAQVATNREEIINLKVTDAATAATLDAMSKQLDRIENKLDAALPAEGKQETSLRKKR